MLTLNPNFRDLPQCLNLSGVRYLVLGGYAVNYHGHHRNTKNIDIWISTDALNADRVSRALQQFGFAAANVPASKFRDRRTVHAFGRAPLRVDLLTNPSGVEFDACFERRIEASLEGVRVPFISLEDLKENKKASGRHQDLADLESLPGNTKPAAQSKTKSRKRRR
jgi:predicted nucleotidyltransferase